MKIHSVLFDLDGVLIDTEGIYSDFWSGIDRLFPTGVDGFATRIKGHTLTEILDTYFAPEDHQAIKDMLVAQERDMQYRLFPGARDVLASLREQGVRTAIVTSSNRRKMDCLFKQLPELRELTDTLVTDEDVTASKPDPQGYLLAAERLGAPDGGFVVCEDSFAGIEAGRRAGAYVAGIATTNARADVERVADVTLDTINDFFGQINIK